MCKSNWNCAWNLAFPVFISPIVWNMCENLHYESVYFKELHNEQEYYWPTIGSFSTDDGNGSENVTLKMSSRFFKLFLVYSNSLEMSKEGEFPWSWFVGDSTKV